MARGVKRGGKCMGRAGGEEEEKGKKQEERGKKRRRWETWEKETKRAEERNVEGGSREEKMMERS